MDWGLVRSTLVESFFATLSLACNGHGCSTQVTAGHSKEATKASPSDVIGYDRERISFRVHFDQFAPRFHPPIVNKADDRRIRPDVEYRG
jgi:hypothetical protein